MQLVDGDRGRLAFRKSRKTVVGPAGWTRLYPDSSTFRGCSRNRRASRTSRGLARHGCGRPGPSVPHRLSGRASRKAPAGALRRADNRRLRTHRLPKCRRSCDSMMERRRTQHQHRTPELSDTWRRLHLRLPRLSRCSACATTARAGTVSCSCYSSACTLRFSYATRCRASISSSGRKSVYRAGLPLSRAGVVTLEVGFCPAWLAMNSSCCQSSENAVF
jgi:hypothetical protein